MKDERGRLKQHIRAAQSWLHQAEDSLDSENDVRGDLKLMLAQAELQRAQEAKRTASGRRWLLRLLPLGAALLLAGGGLLLRQQLVPPVPAASPLRAAEDAGAAPRPQAAAPAGEAGSLVQEAEEARGAAPEAAAASVPEEPAAPQEPTAVPEPEPSLPMRAAEPTPPPQAASHAAMPRIPSEDMQKLMQSAGKALRAP